jgi:PAS domain S-box-containing protein
MTEPMDSPVPFRGQPSDSHLIDGESGAAADNVGHRLKGEESFRRVVEWAPNAMVMVDAAGRIVLVNAETERVFGYRRADLVGQSVDVLVPQRLSGHHGQFRDSFFANPLPRPMGSGRDLYARHADGSDFPVEIGLNPIETDEGLMVLASIVDITERKRAQQRIERALEEKTVLLNELHHRVKNNLQMISSLLSLQAASIDDPHLRRILEESQNRVRAMGLTHQLLYEHRDFSRIDLGEYLGRLAQLLLSAYRTHGGRIAMALTLPAETYYVGLERAVPCGLMVNELVTNAFKHAFPADRRGTITIALAGVGEDEIDLTIGDDGIGLPGGFDMSSLKSLGLRLVPLLAEQIKGRLTVAGQPGCRFSLRFPAARARRATT